MKKFKVTVNGQLYDVLVEEVGGGAETQGSAPAAPAAPATPAAPAAPAPAPQEQPKPQTESAASSPGEGAEVTAPMPGSVLDVKVQPGDQVAEDQVLLILEAMKMENEVSAPCSGKVKAVNVSKGGTVNTGDVMVVIE